MNKIKLGLDIGTNSVGWTVLEKQDKKYDFLVKEDKYGNLIPTKGSYIFQKGADANENSKAAERRGFRGTRKRLQRLILRKIATLKVLNKYGLCPAFEEGELNRWKNKKVYPCENEKFIEWQRTGAKGGNSEIEKLKQPYYLRHLAATKEGLMQTEMGKYQLGRAFYHLSQRRGYLSNSEDDQQTEDKLELFKLEVTKLLDETTNIVSFIEPFNVILDSRKSDKKVETLGKKISKVFKTEIEFEKIRTFIITEFDKPENSGKVMEAIGKLSKEIEVATTQKKCVPTMGSYFYSIYAQKNSKGLVNKIRGQYTHRDYHYLVEFNYICDKQNINGDLRHELHNAIFYQRPLKSQKGLVAKCPLEPKQKRIALSHPLFEEFRMWESINRIKIGRGDKTKLEFLTKEEKELIVPLFFQKTDFEFKKIAEKLSGDETYCYVKMPEKVFFKNDKKELEDVEAQVYFNFPLDKKFSACPTISALQKIIGKEKYKEMQLLNTGYHDEKGKRQLSIEDVWHCLFMDSFGKKDKKDGRKEFAERHLNLDEKKVGDFQKIKLVKGYGSLSKAALKKIIPFLENGEIYSHAVFLANISKVLGRKLSSDELKIVSNKILDALEIHKIEKQNNGIVNNYISKLKELESKKDEILGNNSFSIEAHKKALTDEIVKWVGASFYNNLNSNKKQELLASCWTRFFNVALDKPSKEIVFIYTETIPTIILKKLKGDFPNEDIDVSKLYHPSAMEAYRKADKLLGNPEISSIKNPVFNRAMHQIKRLCNELINKGLVDKDTEVNVEVAGEINSAGYRRALTIWQKEQEIIRDWAKQEIIATYPKDCDKEINPSDTDIVKYILWKEQNHQCMYTSYKPISICDFLGNEISYDIEHTIPRSKCHDNSLTNKTLANADFNRNVKKDILPALLNITYNGHLINKESIILNRNANLKSYSLKNNIPTWTVSLRSLKEDLKKYKIAAKVASDSKAHDDFMEKAHYTKFKLDYLREKYKNFEREEITNQFSNANLVDTRIITKYARAYLNSYFNKVNVVNGKITDTLRKMWGLEGEYAKKDRSNHIHHCIDAITVACVERGTANWISEAFHNYESDSFKGNNNPKYRLKEPMDNFVQRMNNLHKEVFVFHKQTDRIKPLLNAVEKGIEKKENLRGKLNSQNPYAHIKKNDELIFAQRKPISGISGADIENIIDEGIKKRLLCLADEKGWEKLLEFHVKDNEDRVEAEIEHKKAISFKVYEKLKKASANKTLINSGLNKETVPFDFMDKKSFVKVLYETTIKADLEEKKKENYKDKITNEVTTLVRTKGIELLLKENEGVLILPKYYDEEKKTEISEMVIKRVRLKAYKQNQYPLKKYREVDISKKEGNSKFDYKEDLYFLKEKGSNYKLIIYGDLHPDKPDGRQKFTNRKDELINTYNIVKGIFDRPRDVKLLFEINVGDYFLVFDRTTDEINWNNIFELDKRLFRMKKFDDDKNIILVRHGHAYSIQDLYVSSEENIIEDEGFLLKRTTSTLRVIPAKIDALGNIDIEYSKNFISLHSK